MEDRVMNEWQSWQEREASFSKRNINAKAALNDRYYLKLKHKRLSQIARKYRGTTNTDEQVSRALLKGNNRAIEKQLYPNRISRNAKRLFRFTARQFKTIGRRLTGRRKAKAARRSPVYLLGNTPRKSIGFTARNKKPSITRVPGRKITPVQGVKKSKGIRR